MVDKDTFLQLGRIIDAENPSIETREHEELLLLDDPDELSPSIEVRWSNPERRDRPQITVSSSIHSIGASFSVEAPATEWDVEQTIDDHNLLTMLVRSHRDGEDTDTNDTERETVVSVYGPPTHFVRDTIEVVNTHEGEYVFDDPAIVTKRF